jgi:putative phosphoribosyl transferase
MNEPLEHRRVIQFPAGPVYLEGNLDLPDHPQGIVLFAHGSGSSRRSPRNRAVAQALVRAGLGTFLFDLLTAEEERFDVATAEYRFDIDLLAKRLVEATDWTSNQPATRALTIGYFGASTGAAAALVAAAHRPQVIRAVVSRGGRPDLAGTSLPEVRAPSLLIVGGEDRAVLALNRQAASSLAEAKIAIVPGAGHLFEEPGALEEVARLASDWFRTYMPGWPAEPRRERRAAR